MLEIWCINEASRANHMIMSINWVKSSEPVRYSGTNPVPSLLVMACISCLDALSRVLDANDLENFKTGQMFTLSLVPFICPNNITAKKTLYIS